MFEDRGGPDKVARVIAVLMALAAAFLIGLMGYLKWA